MTDNIRAKCPKCGELVLMEWQAWRNQYQCTNPLCWKVFAPGDFVALDERQTVMGAVDPLLEKMRAIPADQRDFMKFAREWGIGIRRAMKLMKDAEK